MCRLPENLVLSGAYTAERGPAGPALPAHYAIAIDDEAVGSVGLQFGSGMLAGVSFSLVIQAR